MTDDVPASQRWRGRPVHSLLIQAFVFAVPIIASVLAATLASSVAPRPESAAEFVAWWAVLTAIALAALLIVDRLARRLLPLAALLKLSMLFPDRAPSRFRIARNAASVRKLQEQLAAARERGVSAEPVWAAETVLTLITALGHHDKRSRGHSERVHIYAELLAEELDLAQADRDRLRWAALLHDVGKLVVPAELLNKPAAPDDEEWEALRTHPHAGAELCAPLLPWLGEWGDAIAQHHEWFDGTGYPVGMKGLEISRAARIVAVADCYEVMTTARTYKRAMNPAAAREELARCAGTQFDPAIVRAFLNISLGRLRLAMGPLALLSTVPSMARLTSLFEPLARAGAVLGGAALIVGGASVMPSDAEAGPMADPPAVEVTQTTADDTTADAQPVAAMTPKSTADRAVAAAAEAGAGPGHGEAPPPSSQASSTSARVRDDDKDAADKNDRPKKSTKNRKSDDSDGKGGADDDTTDSPKVKPADKAEPASQNRPADKPNGKAKGKAKDTPAPRGTSAPDPPVATPPDERDDDGAENRERSRRPDDEEDRGANPTPPTSPPGKDPDHPDDTPPPEPDPPGRR